MLLEKNKCKLTEATRNRKKEPHLGKMTLMQCKRGEAYPVGCHFPWFLDGSSGVPRWLPPRMRWSLEF